MDNRMDEPGSSKMEDKGKPIQKPAMLEQTFYEVKAETFVAYQVVNNYPLSPETSENEEDEVPGTLLDTGMASELEVGMKNWYFDRMICEREYTRKLMKNGMKIKQLGQQVEGNKSHHHQYRILQRQRKKIKIEFNKKFEQIDREWLAGTDKYREWGLHFVITDDEPFTEDNAHAEEPEILLKNQVYYDEKGQFLSFFANAKDGQWEEWNRINLETFSDIGTLPNHFKAKLDEMIFVQLHLLDDNNTPFELIGDHSFHPKDFVNNNKPYEKFVSILKQESTTSRTSPLRFRLTVIAGGRELLQDSVLDWHPVSISAGQKNTEDNVTVPTTEKTNSSQRSVVHIKQVVAKHANIGGTSTVGERDTENNIKLKNTNVKK